MKKYVLWSLVPLLLPSFMLSHNGSYIPDDQLQKEVLTVQPDYEINMREYSQTVIQEMPRIKFMGDTAIQPPVIWEPIFYTSMCYTCVKGEYNGVNYYMRVLPLNEEDVKGPAPVNCPESLREIDALFTKDPHFVFHDLKVGDIIPRNLLKEFEPVGCYDRHRIVLKSDTSWNNTNVNECT